MEIQKTDGRKICPLTYVTSKGDYDQHIEGFGLCQKEGCAWFIDYLQQCVIVAIQGELIGLSNKMGGRS